MRRHTNIQKPELERKKKTQVVQLLKWHECLRLKGQSRNWGVLYRRCMKTQSAISWMWFKKLAREEQGHKWWSTRTKSFSRRMRRKKIAEIFNNFTSYFRVTSKHCFRGSYSSCNHYIYRYRTWHFLTVFAKQQKNNCYWVQGFLKIAVMMRM